MYALCGGSHMLATISTAQLLLAGWGWVVVFSCFFQNLLVDGTLCSFGTMYVYLMEEFKSTSLQTSAILSVQLSLQALLSKSSTLGHIPQCVTLKSPSTLSQRQRVTFRRGICGNSGQTFALQMRQSYRPNKQFLALFSLTKKITCMLSSVLILKILQLNVKSKDFKDDKRPHIFTVVTSSSNLY